MMRLLYTIACMFLTTTMFCQNSTLLQNVNRRAAELKHSLNSNGDTLFLSCERTIYKVEIYGDDYENTVRVRDTKIEIPLIDIPVGRFVVEASLIDKLIIITLLRNTPILPPSPLDTPSSDITDASKEFTSPQKPSIIKDTKPKLPEPKLAEAKQIKSSKPNTTSFEELYKAAGIKKKAAKKEPKPLAEKPNQVEFIESDVIDTTQTTFWIVYEINSSSSSGKEMRIGDKAIMDKMIRRNKLDLKTKAGKYNELTIYEVYDVSRFMKYKRQNNNDVSNVTESEFFNVKPIFTTKNNLRNP